MAKNILMFSDGTGQIGGLKPDQRLSNVYKMYRAMRPGPDSLIKADKQYAFYDPELGTDEGKGLTFRRTRATLLQRCIQSARNTRGIASPFHALCR